MASILEAVIGDVTPFLVPVAAISFTSQTNWQDGGDSVGSNFTVVGSAYVPIGWNAGKRSMGIYKIPLASLEKKIEVGGARFEPVAVGKHVSSYTFPGAWNVRVYEMAGTVGAGVTGGQRDTGEPWGGSGYGPAPGIDFDATPLDTWTIDSTAYSNLGTNSINGPRQRLSFRMAEAIAEARREKRDLYVLVVGDWAPAAQASLALDYAPAIDFSTTAHTIAEVDYWPVLAMHSCLASITGRPADYAKLHDAKMFGSSNRTYIQATEQGTISAEIKEWAVNHSTAGPRKAVGVVTSRSWATSVDSSAGGGTRLMHAMTYDTGSGERSIDADFVVERMSGTTYRVLCTIDGETVVLAEETTGTENVTFGADHIFVLAGVRILCIRAIKWRDASNAVVSSGVAAGAKWRFSTHGDERTTESLDTLSMIRVMPPVSRPFGDVADTATARPLRNAFLQQLWPGGVGGVCFHDVNISGVTHTHLYVRDCSDTDWLTLGSSADAWGEVVNPGVDTFVSAQIEATYGSAHATYPDEIRLNRQLSGPEKAVCVASAVFTGGVMLGDLAKQQVRQTTGAAAAGTNQITLPTPFDAAVTGVRVTYDGVGASTHTVTSGGATSTLTVSPALPFTYPGGAHVSPLPDPVTAPAAMAERPVYFNGKVPNVEPEGLYTGYCDLVEARIT